MSRWEQLQFLWTIFCFIFYLFIWKQHIYLCKGKLSLALFLERVMMLVCTFLAFMSRLQLWMFWVLLSYNQFGALDVDYSSLVKLGTPLEFAFLLGRIQCVWEKLRKITFLDSLVSSLHDHYAIISTKFSNT